MANIRLDNQEKDRQEERRNETGAHRRLDFSNEKQEEILVPERIREEARKRVIDAEKYKAKLEPPKGRNLEFPECPLLEDDDFLHVSCDVDDNITVIIKKGQFIEMAKLLTKQNKSFAPGTEETTMEIINHKSGQSYMLPTSEEKPVKIHNVYMWEKAFRIYMAIYTQEHPTKATEMVQYIHTIHHAASKYIWENVAYYDRVFRQMMAKNPNRSWGKIFTQMWNICLCDPLGPKNNNHNNHKILGGKKANKNVCWRFNKGNCNYPNCMFAHRCTYCGGTNHGANSCLKKGNRKSETNNHSSKNEEGKKQKRENNQEANRSMPQSGSQ